MAKKVESGEVSGESAYTPLTVTQVKQAAIDLLSGSIFGSWQISEHDRDLIPSIFMPLSFLDTLQAKQMERDGVVHVYGHVRDSVLAVNGYPCLTSLSMLNQKDYDRIIVFAERLQAMDEEI